MPSFIVDIIPAVHVARPHGGAFSYESDKRLRDGTLVAIPFGRRSEVLGIVLSAAPLTKKPPHRLRRVSRVLTNGPFFPDKHFSFLTWEAEATITPRGDIIKHALPSWLNVPKRRSDLARHPFAPSTRASKRKAADIVIVDGSKKERLDAYRRYLKEAKRLKKQILILSPTATGRKFLVKTLRGTKEAPLGRTTAAQQLWLSIRQGKPVATIGTKSALRLPFVNLHVVIVDDEANDLYKESRERPYTDARTAAQRLAALHHATYVAGGMPPALSTLGKTGLKSFANATIPSPGKAVVVDLNERKPTSGLSTPLVDELKRFAEKKTDARGLIYINRRGDALALSCSDCGFTFTCQKCDAPMPVYKAQRLEKGAERGALRLRCRHCGEVFIPPLACPACRGLKLIPLGFTTAAIEETLKRFFPKLTLHRLDSDITPTVKEQASMLNAFRNEKGPALLVATRMAFTQDLPKLDIVAVPAFDHMNAIPNFRADEEALHSLLSLRQRLKASGKLLVQTWHPDRLLLDAALHGDLTPFIKNELELREKFGWPPYRRVAKLLYEHRDSAHALSEANHLVAALQETLNATPSTPNAEIIGPTPAFIPRINNRYRWIILIKWSPKNATDLRLERQLRDLVPPQWDIDINPASIL